MNNNNYNHRNFVQLNNKELIVESDKLDIFYTDPLPRQQWKPVNTLKPYNELKKLILDIETSGLDSKSDRIFAIGCLQELNQRTVFMDEDEPKLLQQFIHHLQQSSPDVVFTFNGMEFDLPFIATRCNLYHIPHPFQIKSEPRVIRTAQVFGKPLEVHEVGIENSQHVDVYICLLRWDFIAKKLITSRSLKCAVLEMGLRDTARLVLSYQDIQECWQQGAGSLGWQKIQEYLGYDLEDTLLIAARLVPSYYYESLIVPRMGLQQLVVAGNATKWQRILESQYPQQRPSADPKAQFEGGLVISLPGLHRNIGKIDVSSLYPSIMLKYGICSYKDKQRVGLSILEYLTTERLKLKKLGLAGNTAAKQAEGALKVLINSLFGFYGTSGVSFNDYVAAALITAYGRCILRFMINVVELEKGVPVECDTDGIFFSHPEPVKVFEILQAALPEGINIELEVLATALFVPERGAKNYIIWHEDGQITAKGSWRKRDRCQLEKEFPLQYLTHYLESFTSAEEYYQQLVGAIASRQLSVEQLQVTRKIRKGEKALLCLGNVGDVVTYYHSVWGLTNTQPYSTYHYLDLIAKKRSSILETIKPQALNHSVGVQLTLF